MRYAVIVIGLLLFVTSVVGITSAVSNPDFNYSIGQDIVMIWNVTNRTNATFVAPTEETQIWYLIVGGGGNAGNAVGGSTASGGGGGGGGVINGTMTVSGGQSFNISVGNGTRLSGWTHSPNSTFGNLTAVGGGLGGEGYGYPTYASGEHGYPGGSGGGGGSGTCGVLGGGAGGANVSGQGTYGQTGGTCYSGVGGGAGGLLPNASAIWDPFNSNITGVLKGYGQGGAIPIAYHGYCLNYGDIGSGTAPTIPSCLPPQAGHSGIVVIRVIGVPIPVATFTPNGTTDGISPKPIQFNDTSYGSPIAWNWSYQGYGTNTSSGKFSTSQNPVAVFTTGNYSIRLNVTNAKYTNTSTQTTWINVTTGIVNFTPIGLSVGWDPARILFIGETNIPTPTSWSWLYQGYGTNTTSGSFGVNTNQTYGTFTTGNYSITLNVTNATSGANKISTQTTWINISYPSESNPDYIDYYETCFVYFYTPKEINQTTLPYIFVMPDLKYFDVDLKYLLVGGGGNAGGSHQFEYHPSAWGGGGGAGGLIYNTSFTGPTKSVTHIIVGDSAENTSIYGDYIDNTTAYAGGKGGEGYPDTIMVGEDGADGGSGGGGGSGGWGGWRCQAAGGNGTEGQGYNGYCGYGGYALATSGGGGGAGGNATSPSGGPGVYNNITFYNVLYSEGGSGGDTGYRACKATYGSGGRADWSPYVESCDEGQPGIVIFQMCVGRLIEIAAPPKIVQFHVLTQTGERLPGAFVSVQGITTTTGSWDWLMRLLSIKLDEVPIHNTLMSGQTDAYGTIEFAMIPTTKYNVTTTLDGYVFKPIYVHPHDTEYLIIAENNQTTSGWIIVDPLDLGTKSFVVTQVNFSQSEGAVTVMYNDTSGTTTGGFINITDGATQLYSLPVTTSYFNETRNISIAATGTSVHISARVLTTGDMYKNDASVTFGGYDSFKPAGIDPNVLMWTSFGLLIMTSLLSRYISARHVSTVICVEAWIFLSMGWFNPMTDKVGFVITVALFGLATVICIVWNLREGFADEVRSF